MLPLVLLVDISLLLMEANNVNGIIKNIDSSAVRYVAQTLGDEQKVQARKNIGVDGQVYPCTASALEALSSSDLVGIYNQGYRAVQATNNETVVTLGLAADGSLSWQGCNQGRTNLLDNPDFSTPINQRGLTTYSGSFIYSIDRWVISGTISLQSGGISVSQNGFFLQRMEPLINGEDYTLAVYVGNQLLVGTVTYDSASSDAQVAVSNSFGTLYIQNIDGDLCQIVINPTAQSIISKPVLLKGAYTAKTLPPWEAPSFPFEQLKCMMYWRKLSRYYLSGVNTSALLSPPMRIPPTITGYAQEYSGSGWVNTENVIFSASNNSTIRLYAGDANTKTYAVYLELNSDL